MTDPYEVLGLPRSATPDEVAAAYRRLAQIYHPDRFAGTSPEVAGEAERRMKEVNAAYAALREGTWRPADAEPGAPGPGAPAQPPAGPPVREPDRRLGWAVMIAIIVVGLGVWRFWPGGDAPPQPTGSRVVVGQDAPTCGLLDEEKQYMHRVPCSTEGVRFRMIARYPPGSDANEVCPVESTVNYSTEPDGWIVCWAYL